MPAVPEDHDPRQGRYEHPQGVHADPQLLEGEGRLDQGHQVVLPLVRPHGLGAVALTGPPPGASSTRWAENRAASSIAWRERRRAAGWCAATPTTRAGMNAIATSASRAS